MRRFQLKRYARSVPEDHDRFGRIKPASRKVPQPGGYSVLVCILRSYSCRFTGTTNNENGFEPRYCLDARCGREVGLAWCRRARFGV
jgi:hypothetical protein